MKNNKKGISLIVLVITIIIIIILAGAVILNLANNNPIESASKAKISSDIDTFRSELTLYIGSRYVNDRSFDEDTLNGITGDDLENILPSMKDQKIGNKKYSEVLTIYEGQLVLKEDLPSDFDEKSKDTLEEIFDGKTGQTTQSDYKIIYDANGGTNAPVDNTVYTAGSQATISAEVATHSTENFVCWNTKADGSGFCYDPGDTIKPSSDVTLYAMWEVLPAMIKADIRTNDDGTSNKFVSKEVTYTGYNTSLVNQSITWKIYGVDPTTNKILLITDDYVNLSYKTSSASSDGVEVSGYTIDLPEEAEAYDLENRTKLVNYLKNSSKWTEFQVSGKTTAYGASTLEQFVASFNLRHPNKYMIATEYDTIDKATAAGRTSTGWVVRFNTGTSYEMEDSMPRSITPYDSFYIKSSTDDYHWAWRLASAGSSDSTYRGNMYLISIHYSNCFSGSPYASQRCGVRPIVALESSAKIVKQGGVYVLK